MDLSVPAAAGLALDLIATKEAGRAGYDTVFGNAQGVMSHPITKMTIDEVIADGPRRAREIKAKLGKGSSAAGRYQFMPPTLKAIKKRMHLTGGELMAAGLQDRMGYDLLKVRGYLKFMAGEMSLEAFGNNIAREWASFPVLSKTEGAHRTVKRGETFYAGDGINKAGIAPERVEACLKAMLSIGHVEPVTQASAVSTALPDSALPRSSGLAGWFGRLWGKAAPTPATTLPVAPRGNPGVFDIQTMLLARGYAELGEHDGIDGPKLRAAAANFRRDNGLPVAASGEELDAAFRAALPGAPPRPVSEKRQSATADTLRQEGNPIVQKFDGVKKIGAVIAGFAGVGAGDQAGLVEGIKDTVEQAQSIVTSVQSAIVTTINIVQWSVRHWWLFILAFVVWQLIKIGGGIAAQVISYRLGNVQRASA